MAPEVCHSEYVNSLWGRRVEQVVGKAADEYAPKVGSDRRTTFRCLLGKSRGSTNRHQHGSPETGAQFVVVVCRLEQLRASFGVKFDHQGRLPDAAVRLSEHLVGGNSNDRPSA